MDFNELTDEQKAKARAVKTPDQLLALAKEEGYELSDDELEQISGGGAVNTWGNSCHSKSVSSPKCPSVNIGYCYDYAG